ncbi:MAG: 2Fe-2S iron-sulfur cluster binding domain-containing protein [Saprospiraceae bacterium]|nr:(2Fe-2S)-binding protein [Bacteroidia bacterium]MBT8229321.1 (2Fe-2S)-binding protein [Bacteroidia bacterium]NNF21934.1 2Fe-2S iron-sulfur cluster binding domain-containing protein [Saprospiraceae bacterium]
MKEQITIKIDGKEIKTKAGMNLVDVASENGIFIPSLCYYKHIDPPLGTCRVCTCKVEGHDRPSCTTKTFDGMNVQVNTEDLLDLRKAILEMMFAEGNHFCPSCEKSGDCDMQHMGYEMGVSHTRYPHLFKDRIVDFTPKRIIIEHNRCVKCKRCVEEVFNDDGERIFSFCNRGNETVVGVDYDAEAKLSEEQAFAAMHLCPTGAILVKGKSFTNPFGDRRFDMVSANKEKEESDLKEVFSKGNGKPKEKKIIATTSLAGCFGCHMSLLDVDEGLLDLINVVDFNKSPLTDIKEFTEICDVGLIEGGCCNAENIEVLREFRKKCKLLVSVGECAIWGGVPAMRNTIALEECLEEAYLNSMTTETGESTIPYHEDLPKILDKVYPCHEIVKMDYHIPGCPPSANHIWKAVQNLLWGDEFSVLYSEFKYD